MIPLVELRNVSRRYGPSEVINQVLMHVFAGEHLALLGPSGSGKSTLLRIIAGLDPPSSGEVWLSGVLASAADRIVVEPHERGLAMVFQDLALWPNLTALQNVELGLAGSGLRRHDRRERARAELDRCGMLEFSNRRPGQLSGGQQQRVALARALAVEPRLLLLDEPFSGLDLATRTRLFGEIRALCEKLEITLLVVAHDPFEARSLCTNVAVLEEGMISEAGRFDDVLQQPSSDTLRTFVDQLRTSFNPTPPNGSA